MSTIDQQFVEFIVKTLASQPEKVVVDREIDERGVLLSLTVDPEDAGRVIGRRGATAQSIRTLLRVLGTKNGARYNLKIVNDSNESGNAEPASSAADTAKKEDEAESEVMEAPESELAEKTRAELADLDDLDI